MNCFRCLWIITGLLLGVILSPAAMAQENTTITLINGAPIEGQILEISESGLKVRVGRSTKSYPWYALSTGTRFKYDQSYRMNLEGYLAGKDPHTLTNEPDPKYDPLNPAQDVVELPVADDIASTMLDFNAYEVPDNITPQNFPDLSAAPLKESAFNAVQYGPASDNLLLSGFSPDDPPRLHMLDVNKSRVMNEAASERTIAGTDYYAYPRKILVTRVGDVDVEQRIQWLVGKDNSTRRYVNVEVDLSRGSQKSSFVLMGRPRGFEAGNTEISSKALLIEPAATFTITIEDDKTFLVGKVRMGRLSLVPRAGMDLKLYVQVSDASGLSKLNQSVPFEADAGPGDYPVKVDISEFEPGAQYKLNASISLGAFLGDVEHEEVFIMPDAMKL